MGIEDVLQLQDGRRLAYAEHGVTDGFPVIFMHGSPSSRLFRHPDESIAQSLGVRVITVDRPGFGLSDPKPDRSLLDWPDDVAELADRLGLLRFAVVGVSGGGPYVAACAYRLPQRVTRAALISGFGPLDVPEAVRGMMGSQRAIYGWLRRAPAAARLIARVQAWQIGLIARSPRFYVRLSAMLSPHPDKMVLRRPEVRQVFEEDIREAFRQGSGGQAVEAWVLLQPWGFRLEDIRVLVLLWQGNQDINVPLSMGQYMARAIPGCQAVYCQDEAHLLFFNHWREILLALVG